MSDPTSDVEEIIVMEHHDPEEALADLPLSVETVMQLSVEQLREKLLELGIEPKGRPKPQLQLELLQILKYEIVAPEGKPTSLDQDQLQLQKEQLQLEMLRLKLKIEADIADRKGRAEKQEAEIELQERKDKLDQQRFAAELEAQLRKEAFEAELRKEEVEQQKRKDEQQQRAQLLSLLDGFRVVIDERPGKTTVVEHRIELVPNARPVKQAPYRLHPDKLRSVNLQLDSLLAEGIIEESTSAWAAPILVVPKPDGTGRLCVDFRGFNGVRVRDLFPMARIDALLDRLGGAVFMTKLDMTKAYFQVPVAP